MSLKAPSDVVWQCKRERERLLCSSVRKQEERKSGRTKEREKERRRSKTHIERVKESARRMDGSGTDVGRSTSEKERE